MPRVFARLTHPQEYLRAAERLWGSPAGPHSNSAHGPAAVAASAAPWEPPRPLERSPQGLCGHVAAPGTQPAPQGSPGARAEAGPEHREAPGRLGASMGSRRGLTWTEASLLRQLSKPKARNTPSRTATVEADTSGLLSVRATLRPRTLYFPWGGKARVGLGWGSAGNQEWAGQAGPPTFLSRLS